MYFTENKELQRFEREMKIVPNFERKEVWEYADSCNECKNYKCTVLIAVNYFVPTALWTSIKPKMVNGIMADGDIVICVPALL